MEGERTNRTMRYEGIVIRPPSEADSYLLQVTHGCSHNRCTFCGTYLDKKFSVKPFSRIEEEVRLARRAYPRVRRIFLCDGDALVLPAAELVPILQLLNDAFPELQRIGIYGTAQNILSQPAGDLRAFRELKLGILYLGLESGDDEVLERVKKGVSSAEMIRAAERLHQSGIKLSLIVLLGLGGAEGSLRHAQQSARVVNRMNPRFLSVLTLMLVPGTALHARAERGEFSLPSQMGMLQELREFIAGLELDGCVFRTNHASNYLPLKGRLPHDKDHMLATLDQVLRNGEYSKLRPEFLRGL
jgi:radical SAM superfamily enzyme YgiQ (UPF0313 family)